MNDFLEGPYERRRTPLQKAVVIMLCLLGLAAWCAIIALLVRYG